MTLLGAAGAWAGRDLLSLLLALPAVALLALPVLAQVRLAAARPERLSVGPRREHRALERHLRAVAAQERDRIQGATVAYLRSRHGVPTRLRAVTLAGRPGSCDMLELGDGTLLACAPVRHPGTRMLARAAAAGVRVDLVGIDVDAESYDLTWSVQGSRVVLSGARLSLVGTPGRE